MLKSMTAYGRHQSATDAGEFLWEIRSVNHRYLELSLRLPEVIRFIEPVIRNRLTERLNRGKVDATLRYRAEAAEQSKVVVNSALAGEVISSAISLVPDSVAATPIDPMAVLAWPGVVSDQVAEENALQQHAVSALDAALDDYLEARGREGQRLAALLEERCRSIADIVARLRELRPQVVQRQQQKLRARIEELSAEVDQQRLEQELVFHAQKLDVDEELDRLSAHIDEMRSIFSREEPVGRRLDFLMQELNREANTLGSKSHDSETTNHTVELKVLIEQMREQVQNLE